MFNSKNKNQVHAFYIILCLISGVIFYYIIDPFMPKDIFILKFFKFPISSIPTVFGLLFWIFNKYLWKYETLFGLINFPNLNGKWKVNIRHTIYKKFNKEEEKYKKRTAEITQTASSIKIKIEFSKSQSITSVAHFDWSEFDHCIALYYFYHNKPNPDQINLHEHNGAVKLIYNKNKKKLLGDYWTGKDRNTYGEIEFIKQ